MEELKRLYGGVEEDKLLGDSYLVSSVKAI
jgi:hypothetical protein